MKSFYLALILIFLTAFPSSSPVLEIMEEDLVVHSIELVGQVLPVSESEETFFPEFPQHHCLTPQTYPHPELRPPALLFI